MFSRKLSGLRVSLAGALSLAALLAAAPVDVSSDSPVADAAMRGDRETARSLLKQGVDVNAAQGDGMTALHWAATTGDVELARMLLYAGANVKAATRVGAFTPLLLASKNGAASMVGTLLKAGADANAATTTGTTALMLAAQSGSADAVTELLDHGALVNAMESARGETALMFAAASFNGAEALDVLLKRGADAKISTKVVDAIALEKADAAVRRRVLAQTGRAAARDGRKPAPQAKAVPRGGSGKVEAAAGDEAEPQAPAAGASREKAERKNQVAAGGAAPDEEEPPATAATKGHKSFFSRLSAWFRPGPSEKPDTKGEGRALTYGQLIGNKGGLTALLLAARQGHREAVKTLIDAGADVNELSADKTSALLIATINGHFDLATFLLDRGADPNLASEAGATPLYAAVNVQWAPKALYPQPRAHLQQKVTYLNLMEALLEKGAEPNARLKKKIWYSGYNFDLSGVDESGSTPFWRAAYAGDVDAMRLLVAHGADASLPTIKPPGRPRTGDGQRDTKDVSGLPPVPVGGPAVTPLQAAAGVGYGEGFAANSHRHAPAGWLPAVKYLIEELGADVNSVDHEGNTALHHAAARGDNALILYLVSKGANVRAVNREGQTTADMANGAVQRIQPFPETVALLVSLGAKNNHKCVSC